MRYAGLTDEPERRKREQGSPRNFRVMQQFTSEPAARQWERRMLAQGCEQGYDSDGIQTVAEAEENHLSWQGPVC
jgi:hypothetical protein